MTEVIVFGLGEMAEMAHYYLSRSKEYSVAAFSVNKEFMKETTFHQLPIVPFEKIEQHYPVSKYKMFIPVGYTKVNTLREKLFTQAKKKGYDFITYISPDATVAENVTIGENCFIFEQNNIQAYVEIQNNCVLWSGNHIGHHSKIQANCFITSHVVISGGCEIGKNSFIGVNATLRDHIKIGKSNVIGAGALILTDTEDNKVYMAEVTKVSKVPSNRLRGI